MKKLGILVLFGLTLAFSSSPARADVKILSFQAGGIAILGGGSDSYSGQIAWTPIFGLGPVGLRGEVGISPLKDPLGNSVMLTNFEALLNFALAPKLGFEVGGGAQKFGSGSLGGVLSGGLTIGLVGMLDRVYVTYTRYLPGGGSNEIKAGLGIVF